MKKILNVVSVYFSIPFFFGDQLKHFEKKGYKINLVCSPSEKIKEFSLDQGVNYKEFIIQRKFSIIQDLVSVYGLYKYIKKNKFEIVTGHTPKGALIAMLASFLAGTSKRVFFRHGLVYETKAGLSKFIMINIERFTSLLSTKVICVSPYLIEKSKEDKLSNAKKMYLLNIGSCNGVDVDKFNPERISRIRLNTIRSTYNIGAHDYVIGYVGRLVKDKGIQELVESFIQLKSKHNHIKLLLVGPEEEKDILNNSTRKIIETNKDIITVGQIDDEMEYYYSLMNIFILPTHREGLGTSILEASSMGLPVLTAGHTGSKDAIIDGVTGSYIKISSTGICEILEKYIVHPVKFLQQGQAGRNHMIKNFRQELIWDEIEKKIYQ